MNGWIIYNGQLKSDKILELVHWLVLTAKNYKINLKAMANNHILIAYDAQGKPELRSLDNDPLPDFVISWDKDIPLAKHFEKLNIKVYNQADGILACDNKIKTFDYLAGHGIAMPRTIIGPMVYSTSAITEFEIYDHIIESLGFPMVVKEAYGSFGQQVYLVHNKQDLIDLVQKLGPSPHLFQAYVKSSHGKDVRINIVGNQVVAAMKRVSQDDFRANITGGAKAEVYEPSQEEIDLALKCHHLLKLDFSGVDLLFGPDGPLLCEVNGNPHFKSIYECTGIDVSKNIIEYILEDLKCLAI